MAWIVTQSSVLFPQSFVNCTTSADNSQKFSGGQVNQGVDVTATGIQVGQGQDVLIDQGGQRAVFVAERGDGSHSKTGNRQHLIRRSQLGAAATTAQVVGQLFVVNEA